MSANNQTTKIQELEETARLYEKRMIAMQEEADERILEIKHLEVIVDHLEAVIEKMKKGGTMKIQQEEVQFRPINIQLNKKNEAVAFFNLIDKIGNDDIRFDINEDEKNIITKLSNALANMDIIL